jgi:hypothetical protein
MTIKNSKTNNMKRKTLLFSLLLTFLAPWAAMAQETLTVYSNTTLTQSNAPMFVEYFKNYTITQTVFPASDLTAMSGKTITAITFYTTSTNIPYTTQASAVIYLKEVQNATISAYIDKSTATTVCTGYYEFVSDGNDGGMVTITFTTPFPYNGGNLLFGCENTNRVDCKKMSFKGISQNGASMGGQSTSLPITGTNQRNFLPKTTFTYTFTYSQPVNLQVSSVTDQSATLTWQAPETTSTIVGYSYNYKEHSASEWSTDYQANGTEATLNNLDSFTEYDFRVKALYSGNHESSYVTTTFRTECATITVTAETPWTENFEDFYHVTHAVISPNSDNKAFRMDDGCWNMVNLETGGFNPVLYTSYSDAAFSGSSSVQFYNRGGASILILPEFTNTLNTLQFEFKASYFNIDTQGTLEIGYYYGNAFHAVCTSDRITCGRGSSGHNAIGDYMGPYPLTGEIPSGSRMALRYTPLEGAVIGSTSGVSAGAINLDDFRVSIIPTKTISGVGTEHWADKNGGYYLIASPMATAVDPATVGMITNNDDAGYTYNLYYFDQAADKEWRSYAASSFNLMPGKGYLYASKNGTTLTFTGTPYSGDGKVTLSRANDNVNVNFRGWNLVGNPFPVRAYPSKTAFYIMNGDGDGIIAVADADPERNYVEPMEGIFVIATVDGETMTFSTTAPSKKGQFVNVNVTKAYSRDAALIDRAIVRFDEGGDLPKFQLNPNHTKIYIPQDGTDYAVVHTQAEGEMPVNFKAEENGRYTISIDIEKVSFDYLHLIDNMTGADVDLLALRQAQGPAEYTFNAKTTDYESRFKLVFAATGIEENGASTGSATFAYNNGSEWVINNPSTGSGSATLQVIDMMGRVLSSETINGATTKAINAAQGIYMLRLINGENVKVQKVVVRR